MSRLGANSYQTLPSQREGTGVTMTSTRDIGGLKSEIDSNSYQAKMDENDSSSYITLPPPVENITISGFYQTISSVKRIPLTWIVWFIQLVSIVGIFAALSKGGNKEEETPSVSSSTTFSTTFSRTPPAVSVSSEEMGVIDSEFRIKNAHFISLSLHPVMKNVPMPTNESSYSSSLESTSLVAGSRNTAGIYSDDSNDDSNDDFNDDSNVDLGNFLNVTKVSTAESSSLGGLFYVSLVTYLASALYMTFAIFRTSVSFCCWNWKRQCIKCCSCLRKNGSEKERLRHNTASDDSEGHSRPRRRHRASFSTSLASSSMDSGMPVGSSGTGGMITASAKEHYRQYRSTQKQKVRREKRLQSQQEWDKVYGEKGQHGTLTSLPPSALDTYNTYIQPSALQSPASSPAHKGTGYGSDYEDHDITSASQSFYSIDGDGESVGDSTGTGTGAVTVGGNTSSPTNYSSTHYSSGAGLSNLSEYSGASDMSDTSYGYQSDFAESGVTDREGRGEDENEHDNDEDDENLFFPSDSDSETEDQTNSLGGNGGSTAFKLLTVNRYEESEGTTTSTAGSSSSSGSSSARFSRRRPRLMEVDLDEVFCSRSRPGAELWMFIEGFRQESAPDLSMEVSIGASSFLVPLADPGEAGYRRTSHSTDDIIDQTQTIMSGYVHVSIRSSLVVDVITTHRHDACLMQIRKLLKAAVGGASTKTTARSVIFKPMRKHTTFRMGHTTAMHPRLLQLIFWFFCLLGFFPFALLWIRWSHVSRIIIRDTYHPRLYDGVNIAEFQQQVAHSIPHAGKVFRS